MMVTPRPGVSMSRNEDRHLSSPLAGAGEVATIARSALSEHVTTNLYDVALEAAARWGDREFLVMGLRSETLRFSELPRRADRFGRMLASLGVHPGDRVALAMANSVDWAVAAYGVARAGAITVGVNTRLTAREAAHVVSLTRPVLAIVDDDVRGRNLVSEWLPSLHGAGPLDVLVRSASGARYAGTRDWHEETQRDVPALSPAAELVAAGGEFAGVAAVLSTSGTTSAPKGVMLTHEGLIRLARALGDRQDLGPDERFISISPFFHCSGFMHALLTCLVTGTTLFALSRYEAQEFWQILIRERITLYHGFIEPLRDLAADPAIDLRQAVHFDRAWYSAPATDMARLERLWNVKMCEVYGLTETGGNVSICRADDPVALRHDSDGRPHEGLEVKIVSPETGRAGPDGEPGEICVRGWNVMRGYIHDPESTAKTIDADGWLHTGDQGVRLPGGFIKFLSRLKDVIRVGGENVSPLEIEEVLAGHPAVSEVAVVSAPDPRLTEVPAAFIIVKPGAVVSAPELDAHCRRQLAAFKVPRRFLFVDAFPRTGATNRVQKAELRAELQRAVAEGR
jgi:fatty-acyl-CoA synthase